VGGRNVEYNLQSTRRYSSAFVMCGGERDAIVAGSSVRRQESRVATGSSFAFGRVAAIMALL